MDTSKTRGPGLNKKFWSEDEDIKLIESLLEIHNEGRYKAEGNFKPGHLKAIERLLAMKLPGCDIKAKPHIESRMKTLKIHFHIVHDMITGPNCSGFGWDPEKKTVTAEKPVWDAYLQSHKEATPFKNKSFPYYDELCIIFGKDRAVGINAETPADVMEEHERTEVENNIEEDNISMPDNIRETDEDNIDYTPFAQAPHMSYSQSDGPSRKRRKSATSVDFADVIKESTLLLIGEMKDSSTRLSQAISEEMMTAKQMGINEELIRRTSLSMLDRHKASSFIIRDNATLNFFWGLRDEEKEEWVRAKLDGHI